MWTCSPNTVRRLSALYPIRQRNQPDAKDRHRHQRQAADIIPAAFFIRWMAHNSHLTRTLNAYTNTGLLAESKSAELAMFGTGMGRPARKHEPTHRRRSILKVPPSIWPGALQPLPRRFGTLGRPLIQPKHPVRPSFSLPPHPPALPPKPPHSCPQAATVPPPGTLDCTYPVSVFLSIGQVDNVRPWAISRRRWTLPAASIKLTLGWQSG